jgi:uncharacterized membrane protein
MQSFIFYWAFSRGVDRLQGVSNLWILGVYSMFPSCSASSQKPFPNVFPIAPHFYTITFAKKPYELKKNPRFLFFFSLQFETTQWRERELSRRTLMSVSTSHPAI